MRATSSRNLGNTFAEELYRVVDVEGEPAEAEPRADEDEQMHRPLHPLNVVLYPLHHRVRPSLDTAAAAAATAAPGSETLMMTVRAVGRQLQKRDQTY